VASLELTGERLEVDLLMRKLGGDHRERPSELRAGILEAPVLLVLDGAEKSEIRGEEREVSLDSLDPLQVRIADWYHSCPAPVASRAPTASERKVARSGSTPGLRINGCTLVRG
jgi:hypothetical protein